MYSLCVNRLKLSIVLIKCNLPCAFFHLILEFYTLLFNFLICAPFFSILFFLISCSHHSLLPRLHLTLACQQHTNPLTILVLFISCCSVHSSSLSVIKCVFMSACAQKSFCNESHSTDFQLSAQQCHWVESIFRAYRSLVPFFCFVCLFVFDY